MNQLHHGRRRRKWAIEPPKPPLLPHAHRRIIVNDEQLIMTVHDLPGVGRLVGRRGHANPSVMHRHAVEANAWPRTGRERLAMAMAVAHALSYHGRGRQCFY